MTTNLRRATTMGLIAVLMATTAAAGTATAGHGPRPDCDAVTDPPETYSIPYEGLYYWKDPYDPTHHEVWRESNGVDGLQRVGCTDDTGDHRQPDTLLRDTDRR